MSFAKIENYRTIRNILYGNLDISYQVFGQDFHTSPVVVVFHALTGNSDVCSPEKGWWNDFIGYDKCIDLNKYSVIAFDILGNGYNGEYIDNYKAFEAKDIAHLVYEALKKIGLSEVYAIIGGSLGGGIVWELTAEYPDLAKYSIPIAADWKSSDWLMGICNTQENILLNSKQPISDARRMAMLFYRTPKSLGRKFKREKQDQNLYKVNSWLDHHGAKLEQRFSKKSYLMMNHLLSTINISRGKDILKTLKNIKATIIQIVIDSDILFPPEENKYTKKLLDLAGTKNHYFEIKSDDGHDAFLIEQEQLTKIMSKYF